MRERRRTFATCSEVLSGSRSNSRIKDGVKLYRVWDLWPSIAGATLAPHAMPARWQGQDLVVRVEHGAWVQELSFIKTALIENIRKAMPEVKIRQVRFEVGELPEPPKGAVKAAPRQERRLSDEEIEFIDQAAKEIPDEETREAARSAMKKGFQKNR